MGGRRGECEQTALLTIDQSAWLPGCLAASSLFHHRQSTELPIAPTAPRGQSATPTPLSGAPFVPHMHLPAACASRAIYAPPNVCWTIGFPRFLQANRKGLVELQATTFEYVFSDSRFQSCSRWLPLVTTRSRPLFLTPSLRLACFLCQFLALSLSWIRYIAKNLRSIRDTHPTTVSNALKNHAQLILPVVVAAL